MPATAAVDLPLGEAQQREPRLRVAPQLVRGRVRLLGAREVAATTPDLTDLVVPAGGDAAIEVAAAPRRRRPPAAPPPASHRAGA